MTLLVPPADSAAGSGSPIAALGFLLWAGLFGLGMSWILLSGQPRPPSLVWSWHFRRPRQVSPSRLERQILRAVTHLAILDTQDVRLLPNQVRVMVAPRRAARARPARRPCGRECRAGHAHADPREQIPPGCRSDRHAGRAPNPPARSASCLGPVPPARPPHSTPPRGSGCPVNPLGGAAATPAAWPPSACAEGARPAWAAERLRSRHHRGGRQPPARLRAPPRRRLVPARPRLHQRHFHQRKPDHSARQAGRRRRDRSRPAGTAAVRAQPTRSRLTRGAHHRDDHPTPRPVLHQGALMSRTPWIGLAALIAMFLIPYLPAWLFEGPRKIKHWPRQHVCGSCDQPWTNGHTCVPQGDTVASATVPSELRRVAQPPALEPMRPQKESSLVSYLDEG